MEHNISSMFSSDCEGQNLYQPKWKCHFANVEFLFNLLSDIDVVPFRIEDRPSRIPTMILHYKLY